MAKKFRYALACMATVVLSTLVGVATAPAGAPAWKLVWADEFDGKEIDSSKWDHELGNGFFNYDANQWISGWGNGELEYYTARRRTPLSRTACSIFEC